MLKNYECDCQPGQLNQPKNETRCKAGFEEKWGKKIGKGYFFNYESVIYVDALKRAWESVAILALSVMHAHSASFSVPLHSPAQTQIVSASNSL